MFMFHVALAFEMLALLFAAYYVYYMKYQVKNKIGWINFIGYFVLILSALSIICTSYHGLKMCSKGGFSKCPMMQYIEEMHQQQPGRE